MAKREISESAARTKRPPGKQRLEELRVRAEQSLPNSPLSFRRARKTDILALLHEMDVYRTELEVQNDELQRSQRALQESRQRYAELYDFAPVGYLTFGPEGIIHEANLAAAQLLGVARQHLLHRALHLFMDKEFRPSFHQFCSRVFAAGGRQTCELRLLPKTAAPVEVYLIGVRVPESKERSRLCQAALMDVTARKKAKEQLASSQEELKVLTARLQAAHEAERSILAREIHDELSGTLTALKMDISLLPDRAAKNRLLFFDKLKAMSRLIDQTLHRVHSIVTELRPVVLDKFGLIAAVEWQAGEFQDRWGIRCECRLPDDEMPLSSDRSTAIFRILQEALTNVARHARATRVVIDLDRSEDGLIMTVRDNGKGIDEKMLDAHSSIGLLSMRERAASFGGRTEVRRARGGGTLVRVRLPAR
jgi:two-component system sensor histidine kinase UhpB